MLTLEDREQNQRQMIISWDCGAGEGGGMKGGENEVLTRIRKLPLASSISE